MPFSKIHIIQSYPVWLPLTQTWMYNQIRYLPNEFIPHIACERTQNLDQFRLPNIHYNSNFGAVRYAWNRGRRRIGMQTPVGPIRDIVKKTDAKIIHSHFGTIGWHNLPSAKTNHLRHIITFYGLDVNKVPLQKPIWKKRYSQLFEEANLFLCEGPYMAQSLIEMGCPPEKVKVQHLGIPTEKFIYSPRTYNPGEPLRILLVASFREKKGIPDALIALGKIKDEVPLEITIIGDASKEATSQKEKQRILDTIQSTGLTSKVQMLGFQPYNVILSEAYRHHIFLSPSVVAEDGDTEGGAPVVIIEMMATGMPIVSTSHCDIPEVVNYDIPNWLVKEHDTDALADRLFWLYENPAMWQQLTEKGRRHIDQHFNARIQGEKLGIIYQTLLT